MPSGPEISQSRLSRRAALASVLVAGAAAAGCTADHVEQPVVAPGTTPSGAELDPDVALAAEALTHEQDMLDALRATAARHPRLRSALAAAIDTHDQHVRLLTKAVPAEARPGAGSSSAPATSTAGPSAPSPASSSPASPSTDDAGPDRRDRRRVPGHPQRAVRRLARLEDELSVADRRSSFAAGSGSFARVLASMAGAAAQQSVVLQALADSAGGAR
ncbi:MAG TPA: hypothetical protein VF049_06670 [Nocardioidaceae bacterium]